MINDACRFISVNQRNYNNIRNVIIISFVHTNEQFEFFFYILWCEPPRY